MKCRSRSFLSRVVVLILFVSLLGASALSPKAYALGNAPINKVLATTSKTPVATMPVNEITAATSTQGCVLSGCSWINSMGLVIENKFTLDYAKLQIRIDAAPGYYFPEGLSAYLNNEPVEYKIYANGAYVILSRVYAPDIWAPEIIKQPGGETVEEGGLASFVATASYVDDSCWIIENPGGATARAAELPGLVAGVKVSESMGKLNISGVTRDLDGCVVSCIFSGQGGNIETNPAKITVKYDKENEPVIPDTEDNEYGSETEIQENSSSEEQKPEADSGHVHDFGKTWQYDDQYHWKQCECGEIKDRAAHVIKWTMVEEPTADSPGKEVGKCQICPYSTTRETHAVKTSTFENGRWILFAGIGVLLLIIVLMFYSAVRQNRRKKRARRKYR